MKLPIPTAALSQHILVLGKTRSGKSSTLRVMVEQLLDDKKPVCIIDPKGDWWGIKSSADGKKAGYDVVIFGGTHADVPINAHSGKVVAELVATGNRPCLIDLGGWMVGERTKFFIDFASTLFMRTHGHRWLVVDECHNFAPQGKVMDPQAGLSLHWANRLASEGAGKGIVLMSASQRPQKVHKDYVTSHETLIAKRVIHPLDRDAMKEWIDGCGDPKKGKEVLDTLAGLQRPQAWVWSPEIDFGPKLVEFPMFGTYDSFAVQTGKAGRKLRGWASVDLDDVRAKLATVVEQEKANDPKALRAEIARLTAEAKKASQNITQNITDPEVIEKAEQRGFERGKREVAAEADRAVRDAQLNIVKVMIERLAPVTIKPDKPVPARAVTRQIGGLVRGVVPTPWQNVKPGDRLWVRENLACAGDGKWRHAADDHHITLSSHDPRVPQMIAWAHHKETAYAPSIHMPRWASRLTLIVTAVKIERLQDISEADAMAEGVDRAVAGQGMTGTVEYQIRTFRTGFVRLWSELHGTDCWLSNPEVVALTFSVHNSNIDDMPKAKAA